MNDEVWEGRCPQCNEVGTCCTCGPNDADYESVPVAKAPLVLGSDKVLHNVQVTAVEPGSVVVNDGQTGIRWSGGWG